jgi:two-component system, OmpR family, heavy metal sensor histidine kinase CusS
VNRVVPVSIAARLAVLFAFASALLLAAIGIYLYGALAKELATRNDEHLGSMTELTRRVLADVPALDRLLLQPQLVTHLLVGHDLRLWIYDPDRRILFSSTETTLPEAAWANVPEPQAQGITSGVWHDTPRSAYRLASARLDVDKPGLRNASVLLAMDVSEEVRVLRTFKYNLFVAMAAGVLFAAAVGYFIASRGLRPVVRIARSAQGITASQLQARLETRGVPQELTALVESFNTMLARLEDSFRRLSEFSADLAHELRTPLTNVLGKSQVTLSQARTSAEYREALESNVEDIEHLSRLVSDMLFLARADRAEAALDRETVDLEEEAARVAEFFSVACEERAITIEVRGSALIKADRMMVRRALSNLLSNAIRHSPDGERIEIAIGRDHDLARISVVDRGPGITPEHQSRIFDRFYRADASRTRHSGGTGLGLAIVRSIAKLHGGDVSVSSESGQPTVFSIVLPAPTA